MKLSIIFVALLFGACAAPTEPATPSAFTGTWILNKTVGNPVPDTINFSRGGECLASQGGIIRSCKTLESDSSVIVAVDFTETVHLRKNTNNSHGYVGYDDGDYIGVVAVSYHRIN